MLNKLDQIRKEKSEGGFTIIEVMIVLAIAGLIILIVLIAIPALQRNSRNTAIKNDASAVSATVGEFKSNNDGRQPNQVTGTSPDFNISNTATGSAPAEVTVGSNITVTGTATAPAAPTATTSLTTITVLYNHKCNSSNYTGTGSVTANNRSTAVIYPVEPRSGAPTLKCIET